ncbi:hypothetical protein V6N13_125487 [Hibiscus sabdariffa]
MVDKSTSNCDGRESWPSWNFPKYGIPVGPIGSSLCSTYDTHMIIKDEDRPIELGEDLKRQRSLNHTLEVTLNEVSTGVVNALSANLQEQVRQSP